MKKLLLFCLSLTVLSGCVSIISKYPPIEYYKLHQEPISAKNVGKVSVALMIRDFTVPSEFENENLWVKWDDNRIQKYFYHRWTSDLSELITEFFQERYNKTEAFMSGVVKTSSWVVPDYILEANILEMTANSSEKNAPGTNNAYISMQVSLSRRNVLKVDKAVIFSENYNQKIQRNDNSAKSIVPAFSVALSQLADKILLDIQSAIALDQMKKSD